MNAEEMLHVVNRMDQTNLELHRLVEQREAQIRVLRGFIIRLTNEGYAVSLGASQRDCWAVSRAIYEEALVLVQGVRP